MGLKYLPITNKLAAGSVSGTLETSTTHLLGI
jgi:hypothetical protein